MKTGFQIQYSQWMPLDFILYHYFHHNEKYIFNIQTSWLLRLCFIVFWCEIFLENLTDIFLLSDAKLIVVCFSISMRFYKRNFGFIRHPFPLLEHELDHFNVFQSRDVCLAFFSHIFIKWNKWIKYHLRERLSSSSFQ